MENKSGTLMDATDIIIFILFVLLILCLVDLKILSRLLNPIKELADRKKEKIA